MCKSERRSVCLCLRGGGGEGEIVCVRVTEEECVCV